MVKGNQSHRGAICKWHQSGDYMGGEECNGMPILIQQFFSSEMKIV